MRVWTPRNILILSAVVVAGGLYARSQGQALLSSIGTAINPTDQNNLANRGFNSVYQSITGSAGTLGTDLAARKEVNQENPPDTVAGLPTGGFDFSRFMNWGDDSDPDG